MKAESFFERRAMKAGLSAQHEHTPTGYIIYTAEALGMNSRNLRYELQRPLAWGFLAIYSPKPCHTRGISLQFCVSCNATKTELQHIKVRIAMQKVNYCIQRRQVLLSKTSSIVFKQVKYCNASKYSLREQIYPPYSKFLQMRIFFTPKNASFLPFLSH